MTTYSGSLTFFKGSKSGGGAVSVGLGNEALFLAFAPHNPTTGKYDFKNSKITFKVNMSEIGALLNLLDAKIPKGADGKAPKEAQLAHFTNDKALAKIASLTYSKEYKLYLLSVYDNIKKVGINVSLNDGEARIFKEVLLASLPYILHFLPQPPKEFTAEKKKKQTKQDPDIPVITIDDVVADDANQVGDIGSMLMSEDVDLTGSPF